MPAGRVDALQIGVTRFGVAIELAKRVTQPAPGIAFIVGRLEVPAQLLDDVIPAAELFVLGGEAEAEARIGRPFVEHRKQRRDPVAHSSPLPDPASPPISSVR